VIEFDGNRNMLFGPYALVKPAGRVDINGRCRASAA
jgi:hypothetical protein